jgi:hypothetical protein
LNPESDRGAQAAMLDTAHSSRYIMRSFAALTVIASNRCIQELQKAGATFPQRWREKLSSAGARELECQFADGAPDHRSARLYLQYHMNFIQVEFKSHHLQ